MACRPGADAASGEEVGIRAALTASPAPPVPSEQPTIRSIRAALRRLSPGNSFGLDRPITVSEFYRLVPEASHLEVVNGLIYQPVEVSIAQEQLFGWLLAVVRAYAEERKLGKVFGSRTKMRISRTSARKPDLVFVRTENLELLTTLDIAGAPDFAMEIVESAKSRREAVIKHAQYEDAALSELWILDIARRQLRHYILEAGSYVELPVDPDGEVEPRAIPGLRLKVTWLFQGPDFPSSLEVVQGLLAQ